MLVCVAFVGVGYSAVAPTGVLTESFGTTTTALQNLGSHLTDTSTQVTAVAISAAQLQNSSELFVAALEQANQTGSSSSLSAALASARAVVGFVGASSQSLNTSTTVVARVAKPLSEIDNGLEDPELSFYTEYGPLAATAAFATIVVILGISLLPFCECCKHIHRALTMVGVLFNLLLWILAGTLLVVAVIMSDVCVDAPAASQTAAAVFETQSPPALQPSIQFYTSCAAATNTDPVGVNMTSTPLQQVRDAKLALGMATPHMEAINRQVLNMEFDSTPAIKSAAESLIVDFRSVTLATLALEGSLECDSVQPLYNAIVNGACDGFLDEGLVVFWAMEVAAASMMTLVLLFNLTTLVQHPAVKDIDPDDGYAPGRMPANVVSPVQNATAMHGGAIAKEAYDPQSDYDPDAAEIANHYDAERGGGGSGAAAKAGRRG
jgi:hypothetical protein